MTKEIHHHRQHLALLLERLLLLLFTEEELQLIYTDSGHCAELLSSRSRWIRAGELEVPGLLTPEMSLMCLFWFQSIGRILIEDVDPLSGALRVRLNLEQGRGSPVS